MGEGGVPSHFIGGWQTASIVTLQSGQPLTTVLATALSGTQSNGTDRPDLIANPNLPGGQRNPNHWLNTSAFVAPPVFYDAQGAYSIPAMKAATWRQVLASQVGTRRWSVISPH